MNLKKILIETAVAISIAGVVFSSIYIAYDLGYSAGRIKILQKEIYDAEKRLEELSREMKDPIKYDFGRRL